MECHTIELPFPPSVNGLFGGGSKQKRFKSASYKKWLASLETLKSLNIDHHTHIHYRFYWPDLRVRDGQSYLKATTDYLVSQNVLCDDNWKIVGSESWDHGGVDRENPRVDIYIFPNRKFALSFEKEILDPSLE